MALPALLVHIAPHTPRQPVTSGHINVVITLGPQVGGACVAAVQCDASSQLTPASSPPAWPGVPCLPFACLLPPRCPRNLSRSHSCPARTSRTVLPSPAATGTFLSPQPQSSWCSCGAAALPCCARCSGGAPLPAAPCLPACVWASCCCCCCCSLPSAGVLGGSIRLSTCTRSFCTFADRRSGLQQTDISSKHQRQGPALGGRWRKGSRLHQL